jgi:hypothetical protein
MRCRVLHFTGTCYISYIYPRGLRAPGPARKVERLAGLIIWSLPWSFERDRTILVNFLVDGFNTYHSVCECIDQSNITHGKWFNYRGYLQWVVDNNPAFAGDWQIQRVRLYSALMSHMVQFDKGIVSRHLLLNKALEANGVEVMLPAVRSGLQKI